MVKDKVDQFHKFLDEHGAGSRAIVTVNLSHEGICSIHCEGNIQDIAFMEKNLDIFCTEILTGRLTSQPTKPELVK